MRVALVHHRLAAGGGMERYLLDLVQGFREAGDALEVWARDVDADLAARLNLLTHRIPVLPAPRLWRVPLLSRAVARLRLTERYERVISLGRTRGQHLHVCGGTHPGYLEALQLKPGLRDRFEIAAEHAAVQESRWVVAHACGLKDELVRHHGAVPERTPVIYPPLDTARFSFADAAARAAARRRFALQDAVKYFLFPSMGHARKGFDLLIEAFAALRSQNLRLLVAGRGTTLPMPPNVQMLGYVDDMAALYAAVDCTVLPSRYEPFGLVLSESLQCGTPVICSRLCGVAELMQPQDGIVLPRLDAAALREAILAICDTPPRPEPGFAEARGLTLAAHIEALRALRP